MYNPNYEYAIHCVVEFVYSSNGSFNMIISPKIVTAVESYITNILGLFYVLFVLYTLVVTLLSIRNQWIKINVRREEELYLTDES